MLVDISQSGGVYPSRIIVAGPTPVVRGWGYALASYPPDHTAPGHIAVLLRNRIFRADPKFRVDFGGNQGG